MFGCCLLEECSFLKRKGVGVYLGQRGGWQKLGGMEKEESVVRIQCIREESILNFFKKESHLTFLVKTNNTHSCLCLNLFLRNWAMPQL